MMHHNSIKETAEKILGRPIKEEEGMPINEVEFAEKRLQLKLPSVLREFHLVVGNLALIVNSTERFFSLSNLKCVDNRLVFAEEQQGDGYWGININERYNKDATVYMCVEEQDGERRTWFNEGIGITEFIHSTMYYQCAQASYEYNHFLGNYSFSGAILLDNNEAATNTLMQTLEGKWERVRNWNNLVIYWNNKRMVWFFTNQHGVPDEMVMLSSQTEESYIKLLKELGFYRGKDVDKQYDDKEQVA